MQWCIFIFPFRILCPGVVVDSPLSLAANRSRCDLDSSSFLLLLLLSLFVLCLDAKKKTDLYFIFFFFFFFVFVVFFFFSRCFILEFFSLLFISCWCCAVVVRGFCAEPPPSRLMMSCACVCVRESSQNKRSLRRRRLKSFSLFRLWIYSPPSTHPTDCAGGRRCVALVLRDFCVQCNIFTVYRRRRRDRMCDTRKRKREERARVDDDLLSIRSESFTRRQQEND